MTILNCFYLLINLINPYSENMNSRTQFQPPRYTKADSLPIHDSLPIQY